MYPNSRIHSLLFVGVFLLSVAIWVTGYSVSYFENPDAYDYAQMGRELRTGHGFSTLQIFPRHLTLLETLSPLPVTDHAWSNLYRYPLPTISNALAQIFIPDIVAAAVVQSGVWSLLSIPLLYLVASRLTNQTVALLSVGIYVASSSFWISSYNGMTESLATCLLLLAVFLAIARDCSWKWMNLGIVCGLIFLTRTQFLYLLPLAVLFTYLESQPVSRVRRMAMVIFGFIATIIPWSVRNLFLTGDPMFSFSTSRNFAIGTLPMNSDVDMQLYAPISTFSILKEYAPVIIKKFYHNVWPDIINPISLAGGRNSGLFLAVILLASILTEKAAPSHQYRRFKWGTMLMVVINFLIVSLVFHAERFYEELYPLLILLFVYEILLVADLLSARRMRYARAGATAIIVLATFVALVSTLRSIKTKEEPEVAINRQSFESLARYLSPEAITASDISYKVALNTGTRSIRLPSNPNELFDISDKFMHLDYVLISKGVVAWSGEEQKPSLFETYTQYNQFLNTDEFRGRFQFVAQLPDGSQLYKNRQSKLHIGGKA